MSGKRRGGRRNKGGTAPSLARAVSYAFVGVLVLLAAAVAAIKLAERAPPPAESAAPSHHPYAAAMRAPDPHADEPEPVPPPIPLLRRDPEPAPSLLAPLVPLPPAESPGRPPPAGGWRRFAVAAPETAGRPMVAIVIDDLGVDRRRSERVVTLPGPLTAAFMSYAKDLGRLTAAARAHGHELLLHMPMEPLGGEHFPGPDALRVGAPAEELRRRLAEGLDRFPGMIGLNNHMGSRFTADSAGMRVVMEELKRRDLVFLDSVTTGRSVGLSAARQVGVPAVARDVFLDNEDDLGAIRAQLERTEQVARRHGHAIAIGHPYDSTIQALSEWLPSLAHKGLVLVPLSAIVKRQFPSG